MSESCSLQSTLKFGDGRLKSFWCSVFDLETFPDSEEGELQDVTLLVNTLFTLFKKLHSKSKEAENRYVTTRAELQASVIEVNRLKGELNRLSESPCHNCLILEEEVKKYVKKLKDHESRINSIASILNLHSSQGNDTKESKSAARAYNLVSQMLLGGTEAPLRVKRRCVEDRKPVKYFSELKTTKKKRTGSNSNKHVEHWECILDSEESTHTHEADLLQKDNYVCTSENVVIPETLLSFPQETELLLHVPDNKINDGLNSVTEKSFDKKSGTTSPVISNTPKKQSLRHIKNLSDVQVLNNSPVNVLSVTKSEAENNAGAHPKNSAVDETQDTEKNVSQTDLTNKNDRKPDFWNLKPKHSVEHKPGDKQSRRLKQTQLSVGSFAKRTDVGSLEEFNAGIRKTSTQYLTTKFPTNFEDEILQKAIQESLKYAENMSCTSEDDDIVAESPNASQKKKITPPQDNVNRVYDTDKTVFFPDSKEKLSNVGALAGLEANCSDDKGKNRKQSEELDVESKENTSFDRVPKKTDKSPDFKYRRGAVRKKEMRQALEGWECDVCQKYYETGKDNSSAAQKQHMNHCSRHRDKYPVRAKTPPGFWDPDFPTTQQCRNKMLDVTHAGNMGKTKGKKCTK